MSNEYSLLVRTDSYTGNSDTLILGALFGIDDGRWGGERGVKLFMEHFSDQEDTFGDIVTYRPTIYGEMPYRINNDFHHGYNTLEIFIDDYVGDNESILETCIQAWKNAYNGVIKSEEIEIKLLSFHLKAYFISTSIYEIIPE